MGKTRTIAAPNASAIVALRKALGLSQQQVANRGGITRDVVTTNERGARKLTSFPARVGLAKGLGITLDEFNELVDGQVEVEVLADRVRTREPANQESDVQSVR